MRNLRRREILYMIKRKIISLSLVSFLLVTMLPLQTISNAQNINKTTSEANTSQVEEIAISSIDIPAVGEVVATAVTEDNQSKQLEEVLKLVKGKLSIPKELNKFDSYYNDNNYNGKPYWNLNWHNEDYTKRLRVQSDEDGNILNYYLSEDGVNYLAPKFIKEELVGIANKFIKTVAKDIYDKLEYVGVESLGTYSGQYLYTYRRIENDVAMSDNVVTVGVNYNTGKVVAYSSNYLYDVSIPKKEIKITEEQAKEIIGKNVKMELSYQNAYVTDAKGNTTIKAFLVYSPNNSYIAVDAKTGEVYTTKNTWVSTEEASMEYDKVASTADSGGLTKEELAEIDNLKGLISKEDAIKAVTSNSSLWIDGNLKATTANLYKQFSENNDKNTSYAWHIYMTDPREVDYNSKETYRPYASATVDAKTGKIISFYASVKDYSNMSKEELTALNIKYDLAAGQKVLEAFVKAQIPDIFAKSEFMNNDTRYIIYDTKGNELPRLYNYNYNRVNEGVPYDYNGIYGSVDGVTGKITSFSYNWNNNITFESPKNVMSPAKAFDYYMNQDGFELNYEVNTINSTSPTSYSVKSEVRLVYNTNIYPSYISPFTGKQLDINGEEYVKSSDKYIYSDIKGNSMERNIKLLADIGIGFTGGKFEPNKEIKGRELKEFLNELGFYNTQEYKILNNESSLNRLEVSKVLISLLGYEKLANIKGIYTIDFADKKDIDSKDIGTVSIINGLEIIKVNSKNQFRPNDKLTRGETANLLIELLSARE